MYSVGIFSTTHSATSPHPYDRSSDRYTESPAPTRSSHIPYNASFCDFLHSLNICRYNAIITKAIGIASIHSAQSLRGFNHFHPTVGSVCPLGLAVFNSPSKIFLASWRPNAVSSKHVSFHFFGMSSLFAKSNKFKHWKIPSSKSSSSILLIGHTTFSPSRMHRRTSADNLQVALFLPNQILWCPCLFCSL